MQYIRQQCKWQVFKISNQTVHHQSAAKFTSMLKETCD